LERRKSIIRDFIQKWEPILPRKKIITPPKEYGEYFEYRYQLIGQPSIPPSLQPFVPKPIYGTPLPYPNITPTSVKNMGWRKYEGYREFVQNILDEMQEVTGTPRIWYETRDDGIIMWDYGRGIDAEDWFGRPEATDVTATKKVKPAWARGRFGEGMKQAVGVFLNENIIPFIFSKNTLYVPYYEKYTWRGASVLCLNLNYIENVLMPVSGAGTVIYFYYGYMPPSEDYEMIAKTFVPFDFPSKFIATIDDMPNRILDGLANKLFVRNMFVCDTVEAFGLNTIWGYDLWWVELERDRRVASVYSVESELGRLLNMVDKSNIWYDIFNHITNTTFLESNAVMRVYDTTSPEVVMAMKEAWVNIFGEKSVLISESEVFLTQRISYLGYNPVLIPNSRFREYLKTRGVAPSLDEVLKKEGGLPKDYVDVRSLSNMAKMRVSFSTLLLKALIESYYKEKTLIPSKVAFLPITPAGERHFGEYDGYKKEIVYDYYYIEYAPTDRFLGTVIHEFTHYLEEVGDPLDWVELQKVSGRVLEVVSLYPRLTKQLDALRDLYFARVFTPTREYTKTDILLKWHPESEKRFPDTTKRIEDSINRLIAYSTVILRDAEGWVYYTDLYGHEMYAHKTFDDFSRIYYDYSGFKYKLKRIHMDNPKIILAEVWIYHQFEDRW
jgi:hypothetical protein